MRLRILQIYLTVLAIFILFWWPLSHWFYPDRYHQFMGFENYDYSLVKIIGTIGIIPVIGLFFTAANPIRNRDFVIVLLILFPLLAATYIYLISFHGLPEREYINVTLLLVNTVILGMLYPWKNTSQSLPINIETMNIYLATTDKEIAACYTVISELRPHIPENQFISRVKSQEKSGYRLAIVEDQGSIVAVAGFRIGENLAWGRFLYIDDLVTDEKQRSRGYGSKLLSWVRAHAINEGCQQLHLDSGIQRHDAHRFYERESMSKSGFHFTELLSHNHSGD